jgi:AraC-like DNA-binding protein
VLLNYNTRSILLQSQAKTARLANPEHIQRRKIAETVSRLTSHHLPNALVDVRRGLAAIDASINLTRRDLYTRLDRACAFLHDNPHRHVPLDELARVASLSQFHPLRSYKGRVRSAAASYHRRLCLEPAAAERLKGGRPPGAIANATASETCVPSGARSVGKFGCTPQVYMRERHWRPS